MVGAGGWYNRKAERAEVSKVDTETVVQDRDMHVFVKQDPKSGSKMVVGRLELASWYTQCACNRYRAL